MLQEPDAKQFLSATTVCFSSLSILKWCCKESHVKMCEVVVL